MEVVKHAARVGCEMGADIVKVSYTGSPETFREVVEGCTVPVVIAGGAKMDSDRDILEMVKGAMDAGGAGRIHRPQRIPACKIRHGMVKAMASIIFMKTRRLTSPEITGIRRNI